MRMGALGFLVAVLGGLPYIIWNAVQASEAPALLTGLSFFLVVLGVLIGAAGVLRVVFVEPRESGTNSKS